MKEAFSIDDAIIEVLKRYKRALKDEHVHKPIAYALYHAWKEVDRAGSIKGKLDEILGEEE